MKDNLGAVLQELRKRENLTAEDASEKLKEIGYDISIKTISGYETGRRMPNADVFMALCKIYRCKNILEMFSFVTADYSIPDDTEWDIIEKYRSLDPYGQETVSYILDREAERVTALSGMDKDISGQAERIAELEAALSKSPSVVRMYTYMQKIAAAGTGFYFEDIPTDTITAPYLEGADFIIGVSGDSMEPTYSDGDLVYVQKAQIVETGDIGIFMMNNECFIKEAGKNGLISHNTKYAIIPGNENIICVGKVLGKVMVS